MSVSQEWYLARLAAAPRVASVGSGPEVAEHEEGRRVSDESADRTEEPRVGAVAAVLDGLFFLLGAVAAGALAVLTVRQIMLGGITDWWLVLVLWIVIAYLLLPRVHTMLALVYVPDYFIGRTRVYEGLLGDPVNVALRGSAEQVHEAMSRAGWRLADELGFRSGLRIVLSTLTRRTYATAPVSPLFLFGRVQEFTYQQEVEGSPARRHHVRFWRTPDGWYLPGGASVDWLAAGTYDKRVGLSLFTLQITHKIDKHVDQERDHILRTVGDANDGITSSVIEHFSSGYHSRNGGGDAIITDGALPVLDLRRLGRDPAPATAAHGTPDHESLARRARDLLHTVQDTAASNRIKRPITLYLAYGLVLLRAAVALLSLAVALSGALGPLSILDWLRGSGSSETPLLVVPLVLVAVLGYVALGQLAFNGHPIARSLALTVSVGGIAFAVLQGPTASTGLDFQLWIANLGLDIGILLTLSAGDVRDFALGSTEDRMRRASPTPTASATRVLSRR